MHVARDSVGWAARDTAPVGIIFHVARCGSTLLSQSLKRLDDLVVYAEPQPVNEILAPPHKWPRADLVAALRTLSAAFARHARRPYVLKLSSWNTLYCDIVAEAFPDTPWVLSLRDPVEVGVSLLASPPGWFAGHGGGGARARGAGGSGARLEIAGRVRRARLRRILRGGGGTRRQPWPAGVVRIPARGSVEHRRAALLAFDRCRATRPHRRGGAAACQGRLSERSRSSPPTLPPNRTPRRRSCAGRSIRSRARNWSASRDCTQIQCDREHFNRGTRRSHAPCSHAKSRRRGRTSPRRSTSSRWRSRGTVSTRHCSSSARRSS